MKKLSNFILIFFILTLGIRLIGCDGGGDGSGEDIKEGVFLDSAVKGLYYETDSQYGFTDINGIFKYKKGELITFSISPTIILGQTLAKSIITPIDLVEGATDVYNDQVTNICRFLQTLDDDGNVNNGITITEHVRTIADGLYIDFNLDMNQFENETYYIIQTLTAATSTGAKNLVSIVDAQNHLNQVFDIDNDEDGTSINKGDCELVINPDGPGFLKIANYTNGYIHVMLHEYAFGACVRPETCELYGLDVGYRDIEISQCSDSECDDWISTKEKTINIKYGDTHEIIVNEIFFQDDIGTSDPANCTDGCWRKIEKLSIRYEMEYADIWGSSSNDVFISGAGIFHYDGSGWKEMISNGNFYTIWGASASNVYTFRHDGFLYEYNGVNWLEKGKIASGTIWDIWGTSSSNIFAVGNSSAILHYDGSEWTTMPYSDTYWLSGIWGASTTNLFIIPRRYYIYEYVENEWSQIYNGENELEYNSRFFGIWGTSSSNVFVVGEAGLILHFNGSSWNIMNSGTTEDLYAIWGSSKNNVFAVGANGTILHYDGTIWSSMEIDTSENLLAVWGASEDDIFAFGSKGTIFRY